MKTEKEIRAIAEKHKQHAVFILNTVFLKTPTEFENTAATALVDLIVSAAVLEISATLQLALESSGVQKRVEEESK